MKLSIDFQTHTNRSPECGWMAPETLVRRAESVGLDGVAITDHNTMDGVGPARRAASDQFLVISAEEVDTPDGQIIGLFLEEPIEPWQSPRTVIQEIHDQGGLALAPHPFDAMRSGLSSLSEYTDVLDAVETINSRCVRPAYNRRALEFAQQYEIPKTGGSDSHFAHEIGTAYTDLEIPSDARAGESLADPVKQSLRDGRVSPVGGRGSIVSHAGTKCAKLYNRLRD
ncbi:PHP-associated domain-containing protein [Halobaculum magnesiiphilum]|uniref:PHP domain-containing protein n=1 Tax=Halobaculum magnesiiphilum TaxID=1017351 RepID=A0A8T8WB93_9EURY|nr:PHP domain-containing protein [Halobaculum magnesiiphilum]QZP37091.1 PHP domain-containing protein [Halobaculum magnesiiphilum]